MHLVELNITTFRGSIGGEHYYGQFRVHGNPEHPLYGTSVERPVDQAEADYLNEKDGNQRGYYWIEAGDMVSRFNSIQQLTERAAEVFPSLFHPGVLFHNPQREIDDPTDGRYWVDDYVVLWGADQASALAEQTTRTARLILKSLQEQPT